MKKRISLLSYLLCMAIGFSTVFSSCKGDDDPAPEVVADEIAYYIVGEVLSEGRALEGVSVKVNNTEASTNSNGAFELKLTQKGDFTVLFSKADFVSVSSQVTISSNAKNKSAVTLRQALTKKNEPVRVTPDREANIGNNNSGAKLLIPAGAVSEAVDISMTPFIPGGQNLKGGAASASLISLNLEPSGLRFNEPVEISLANPMGDIAFGGLKHMVEENGVLKEVGEISYDSESGTYKALLTGFSNHSFTISANVSAGGSRTESLGSTVIDNLGHQSAKSETITVSQKTGWTMGSISGSHGSLTDHIANVVSSMMGSAPGTGETPLVIPFEVSGDVRQTIEVVAIIEIQTFSFPIILADGSSETISVSVNKYTGSDVNITRQYGEGHTDHSGGSGQ